MTLKDSHSAISSPGSASGLTPCGAPDGLTVAPSGQVHAPASHSASQENAGDSTTPATCGPHGFTLYRSAALTLSLVSRLAYADNKQRPLTLPARGYEDISRQWNKNSETVAGFSSDNGASPVNGFWRDADWLFCRDGKWRPVKPGIKPLVNGTPGRVGQLRAYGNAIVAPVAETFIRAYMEAVTP